MDSGEQKRQKSQASFIVGVIGQAARIAPKLQDVLGSNWEVVTATVQEAESGKVNEAVAIVTPPIQAINCLLTKLSKLRLLQTMSAGIDFLDLESCPAALTVCNTSTMDNAIAEYVMASMLHWQIGLVAEDKQFREKRSFLPPFRFSGYKEGPAPFHGELGEKVLGIVGYGHIGSQIAKRAAAFNMRIRAITHRPRNPVPDNLDWCGIAEDLPRLLKESDFVVICCALTPETRGFINEEMLGQMRQDAVIINVARGPVVDEQALYSALVSKRIRGAVIDVWWKYPTVEEPDVLPSEHPFHTLDNVIMTPHFSGWTSEQEGRKVEQVQHNIEQVALKTPSFRFVCKASKL